MPESSCVRRGLIPLDSLAAYWYHNWALEKSGEIAMHSHLLPGAFAKRPLCEMLTPETIQIPITFLYGGGSDWMSSSHGDKLAEAFAGKQSVEVLLVPGAGHQVFMDNASAFNQLLLGALARLEEAERRILTRAIPTPFEMTKVAQLGTVVVPCSDEEKRAEAKNLVLIHGFAGGNAVWATVRFPFTASCRVTVGTISSSPITLCVCVFLASPAGVPHPPPPPDPTSEEAKAHNRSWLRRMALSAWENGLTPMSIARFVGPYGPQLVQNVVQRRISFMSEGSAMRDGRVDLTELGAYLYHNWALKPSGERAMTTHLIPGAHAVRPLVDLLTPENVKMPLTFIYGDHDWMDYRNGLEIVQRFKREGRATDLIRVPNSGHQMFLENPDGFNQVLVDCLTR
ncbi:hypothetical protein BBJ28_00001126 [Nothophytophthora sp. Chile5]|nr:hypothetical protein BBJ28_00001126 [Nothophytophthora sp. Chile5]